VISQRTPPSNESPEPSLRRCLPGQVASVVADLPLFLTAPLSRRRHLSRGSTPAEVTDPMGGDELQRVKLGRPSANTIVPELQHVKVGQWISLSPTSQPAAQTAFRVRPFGAPTSLLWAKPDGVWSWRLTRTDDGGTRLVTRIHAIYDWSHPLAAAFGVVLMEFGDFAMMRRMLLGIRQRAESGINEERPLPEVGAG